MEVSNDIREDIRKTQTDLKNAIRVHQVWVARLQEDDSNGHIKCKVKDAEKEIIAIGNAQKLVVERLRRELELYQQRLKARNKQVNIENDNRYIAQQLRDHQLQYRHKKGPISLLKPSVLTEIHIKSENCNNDNKSVIDVSDTEKDSTECSEKYLNNSEPNDNQYQFSNVRDTSNDIDDCANEVKTQRDTEWQDRIQRSDSDSFPEGETSPSPSPPPLPNFGDHLSQEAFLRLIGLVTPRNKEVLEKKLRERRKRSTTSTNRNEFIYGNFDMISKRKKYNNFPYLQTHNTPPQTRSAKLRKQQKQNERSSREGSPSGSSGENKVGWPSGKPPWAASLPPGLTVEPVYSPSKKHCHGCGRNDVPSLLVWCSECGVHLHTGCGDEGRCPNCNAILPDPSHTSTPPPDSNNKIYRDKLLERKRLQEKNIQLCIELRKLEARAASLKDNLDEHQNEKRQLLADQIKTQRNLQKLLDFINQFKETSISLSSTSVSECGSEISKSNEE